MGQQQEIDLLRLETEGSGVELMQLVTALEHAAIDKDLAAGGCDQVTGSRYLACRTMKSDLHLRSSLEHVALVAELFP
ncbi:MAG: hypothetical protein Tsb0019_29500 [Roseibium sp.]